MKRFSEEQSVAVPREHETWARNADLTGRPGSRKPPIVRSGWKDSLRGERDVLPDDNVNQIYYWEHGTGKNREDH